MVEPKLIYAAVIRSYAAGGPPPDLTWFAEEFGLSEEAIIAALRDSGFIVDEVGRISNSVALSSVIVNGRPFHAHVAVMAVGLIGLGRSERILTVPECVGALLRAFETVDEPGGPPWLLASLLTGLEAQLDGWETSGSFLAVAHNPVAVGLADVPSCVTGELFKEAAQAYIDEHGARAYVVEVVDMLCQQFPPSADTPVVGTIHVGGVDKPLAAAAALALELQGERFFLKFGRYPEGDDPILFDPDADEPAPLKEDQVAAIEDELEEAMEKVGVHPALAYATKKTGMIVSADNRHLFSDEDMAEWNAALDEYDDRHRPGRFLRRRPPRNRKQSDQDQAVADYLETLQWLFEASKLRSRRREMSLAWATLRDARIFCIPDSVAGAFIHAWNDATPTDLKPEDRRDEWPERFPFRTVWLGYPDSDMLFYHGVVDGQVAGKPMGDVVLSDVHEDTVQPVGHLLTSDGDYWAVERRSRDGLLQIRRLRRADGAPGESYALGELGPLLVEYINQHRTMIVEEEVDGLRRTMKQSRKLLGIKGKKVVPPPYYRVRVRSKLITEVAERKAAGTLPGYRHDVRGHERCRVRRGVLPIVPEARAKLEERGYKVFSDERLDAPTLARLVQREVPPKGPGEWLAVKVTWVDAHISPKNEELPYVPACRELEKSR